MCWRHRIAVVLLTVFAVVPAAGALCAMTCLSESNSMAAHHRAGQQCDDPAPASGPQVSVRSHHGCQSHEGAVLEIVTTAPQRDGIVVTSPSATNEVVHASIRGVPSTRSFAYTPEAITAPHARTPLVLRI